MKKVITIIIATLFINLSLFAQDTSHRDEPAVHALIATLEDGWNTKSGKTFSSVFADVHDYIVVNGLYFSGFTRQGNAAAHQGLFDGIYKNRIIKLVVDKVTFFRPDLAQIIAIGGSYEKGSTLPEDPSIIMTVIAEKKNEVWKIISFHNHSLEGDIKQASPMPMNVMYASWYKK